MKEKKQINIEIGSRIKKARESAKLTQEKFAEMIQIGTKNVSAIERGAVGISVETAIKICEVLSISSDTLFFEPVEDTVEIQVLTDRLKRLPPKEFDITKAILNKLFEAFSLK